GLLEARSGGVAVGRDDGQPAAPGGRQHAQLCGAGPEDEQTTLRHADHSGRRGGKRRRERTWPVETWPVDSAEDVAAKVTRRPAAPPARSRARGHGEAAPG